MYTEAVGRPEPELVHLRGLREQANRNFDYTASVTRGALIAVPVALLYFALPYVARPSSLPAVRFLYGCTGAGLVLGCAIDQGFKAATRARVEFLRADLDRVPGLQKVAISSIWLSSLDGETPINTSAWRQIDEVGYRLIQNHLRMADIARLRRTWPEGQTAENVMLTAEERDRLLEIIPWGWEEAPEMRAVDLAVLNEVFNNTMREPYALNPHALSQYLEHEASDEVVADHILSYYRPSNWEREFIWLVRNRDRLIEAIPLLRQGAPTGENRVGEVERNEILENRIAHQRQGGGDIVEQSVAFRRAQWALLSDTAKRAIARELESNFPSRGSMPYDQGWEEALMFLHPAMIENAMNTLPPTETEDLDYCHLFATLAQTGRVRYPLGETAIISDNSLRDITGERLATQVSLDLFQNVNTIVAADAILFMDRRQLPEEFRDAPWGAPLDLLQAEIRRQYGPNLDEHLEGGIAILRACIQAI